MVTMRIQRPSTRSALTALKDWEPPLTCMTARVRPCVGRTLPTSRGSQSIWLLNTPVKVPCRSGLHQRSEEHTSELQSLMRISYAVFCLKKKKHHSTTEYIIKY